MTVFDAVTDVIGLDSSINLMEKCGGLVFYIPMRPAYYRKLRGRVEHLRRIGWSEADIVGELANEFNKTPRAVKEAMGKIQQRLFDED